MQNHANLAMFFLYVITCMYVVDWLSIVFHFRIRALHNQHWALCKQDKKFIVEKSIIYICPEEFNAGLDITIISNCGLESRVFFFPSCSCRKSICFRLNICLKEWYSYVFNVLFLFKRRKKKWDKRWMLSVSQPPFSPTDSFSHLVTPSADCCPSSVIEMQSARLLVNW